MDDSLFFTLHVRLHPVNYSSMVGYCGGEYNAVELADTQIFLMHSDGSGLRQLTKNGTNLWPTFLNNKRVLFASSGILEDDTFNIFAITTDRDYENFYPAVSHDGLKLLWSRNTTNIRQLNLYLALVGKF
ncbi:unnamed protein product [Wuchereria bancrofti]|uniref:Uncharacterized protein n=1 Tax=Wuchereria bancrofti TaxID=6293 RepID=A0A3P7EEW4_WUCBA|nr:unnamed protein product [Wuchereria bancrofti]